ncbi:MAG: hydrogenase iron-sulfur subunit [Candidatus Hodarchaeales archaeon]
MIFLTIGAFICECRGEIGSRLDLQRLKAFTKTLDDVSYAENLFATCSPHGFQIIQDAIQDHKLERLVFIGCSPKYYESYFRNLAEKLGINAGLVHFANVREQVGHVHRKDKEVATRKAKTIIKATIAVTRHSNPIETSQVNVRDSVAIIGGGIGGIKTALTLAYQSIDVQLIEKGYSLGGRQLLYSKAFPRDECSACAFAPWISELAQLDNVRVMTQTEVQTVRGRVGDYLIRLKRHPHYVDRTLCNVCGDCSQVCDHQVPDPERLNLVQRKAIAIPFHDAYPRIPNISEDNIAYCQNECSQDCLEACKTDAINLHAEETIEEINVGAIVVSTGAQVYKTKEYGYGRHPDILDLAEYERLLAADGVWNGEIRRPSDQKAPQTIGFVLCVDRGSEKVPYCSRYCCASTAAAVRQTAEKVPDSQIYVFYRDIFAQGKFGDEYIRRSQALPNVQWIRNTPGFELNSNNTLNLLVNIAGGKIQLPLDMLVLATPLVPIDEAADLRDILGLDKTEEGFFSEADIMLAPVSSHDPGKYLAGSCIGPRTISETVVDASAVAGLIADILKRGQFSHSVLVSEVDEQHCGGCGVCVKTCLFHAASLDPETGVSVVDLSLCRGCGNCVAACPAGARDLVAYSNDYFFTQIDILAEFEPPQGPKVLGLFCDACAYHCLDNIGLSGGSLPPNFIAIRSPCTGRIDSTLLLYAMSKFDGVMVGGCYPKSCQYIGGNFDAEKRVDLFQTLMDARGLDPQRLRLEWIAPTEVDVLRKKIEDFVTTLEALNAPASKLEPSSAKSASR